MLRWGHSISWAQSRILQSSRLKYKSLGKALDGPGAGSETIRAAGWVEGSSIQSLRATRIRIMIVRDRVYHETMLSIIRFRMSEL